MIDYSWLAGLAFKIVRITLIVVGGWIVVHYIQKKVQDAGVKSPISSYSFKIAVE